MKNSFKKIALLCTALAMNASAFAISTGGAVAAGFGTAAAVGLLAYGISKKHKHNKDKKARYSHTFQKEKKETPERKAKAMKHELVDKIHANKEEIKRHKHALRKLTNAGKGSTEEAKSHESMIEKLKNEGEALKMKLMHTKAKMK